jgi:uncharacterized protein
MSTVADGQMNPENSIIRSRYNFYIERAEGVLVFNARKGTFTLLSFDIADILRDTKPINDRIPVDILLEVGILHTGDEFEQIRIGYQGSSKQSPVLSFAIVPTLACNLACDYCYQTEYRHNRKMSDEVIDLAIKYIESRLQSDARTIDITWYGGEPLLELDTVLAMSERISRSVCRADGHLLPMKMVSNGLLLEEVVACQLSNAGIKYVQVSIDALHDDGCSRRGVIDEDGNLSKIVRNIIGARRFLDISIRFNVSKNNEKDINSILKILDTAGLKELVSLERITDLEGEAGATVDKLGQRRSQNASKTERRMIPIISADPNTLRRADFAKLEEQYLLDDPAKLKTIVKRLTPKTHFCGATAKSLFVIDPDGNISRCWQSAGSNSESIGNVRRIPETQENEIDRRWDSASPFIYSACSSCRVLPLCMGGCSHPRLFMDSPLPPCESIKFQIQNMVAAIGKRLAIPAGMKDNEP